MISFIAAATLAINLAVPNHFVHAPHVVADVGRATNVTDLGRSNVATPVSLTILMKYRNEAELDQLIAAQSNPESPWYGHFLTNAQFNDRYAPTPFDYQRAVFALVRAGFRVETSDNRTIIGATAPAPIAERYFGTEFHNVIQRGHAGLRYINTRPATMPADLEGLAAEVVGFDTITRATRDSALGLTGPRFLTDGVPAKLTGPDGGYGPWAVAQGFDYPVQHGFDGKGHAAGITIDYDTSNTDLAKFDAYFGIKRTGKIYHVPVDGGQPYDPSGGSIESTLDMETIASLDPGADVYIYNFGSAFTFKEISDGYNKAVADDKVDVVSSSFGLCEDNSPSSFNNTVNSITKQGVAKGISFVTSTGDYGRGGKCADGTGQDVPAVLTYFTSVGGVDLTVSSAGKVTSEPEDSGSGGGPSDHVAIPNYQVGLAGIFSTTKRNIPDVSGPFYADSFYYGGWAGPIGGTSWAAPATAAFIAERNEVRNKRLGWANPAIYAAFKAHGYTVFHDITKGNNGIACKAGYDDCSGIGTLKGYALSKVL